ncbi:Protein AUXIN RESPONSE 4 [Hibiscus syriacus]|uniref:Protein AUXIN RESPONSE 4 n=1 Tax=Hibiscus syriacus TaxID=106335 RepID=A0A6A3AP95_HIBSY|nr:protein AUXIN RESPONSE 4-like isoform X1 [Hibiscus syriacus]XP_038998251.1 protein AUXIN RESPONSE 4-like isoform X1 [Hibiscus syriacus]KAE8706444.1 Protein AUXIN RESPONSE 4 [Hibiscus syriacus]
MAIITEEVEPESPPRTKGNKKIPKNPTPEPSKSTPKPTINTQTQNPFAFWFYFTFGISLITFLFVSFSSLPPQDPKSWFLSLPYPLRQHYSNGRIIKVQTSPNQSPIEVFVSENGQFSSSENVMIVHGLGLSSYSYREMIKVLGSKGVHVIALDLPGNGFSDKSRVEIEEGTNGVLGRFKEVYSLIQEKGVFWAFDQMVETGELPYEEIKSRVLVKKNVNVIEIGSEEMGSILGQVIGTMGLAPVHLVLHDSAFLMAANWISENSRFIRSVTLIDTGLKPALPTWVLNIPVVNEIVLRFSFVYARFINLCCTKGINQSELEAHRSLLKGWEARKAVVGIEKKLNHSFNVEEWGCLDDIKGMPMQVLWSNDWSDEWSEEGKRTAEALPGAKFVTHSGGRWPQESVAGEVAENVAQFVSSLPKTVRQVEEEPISEHIQKMFDEAKDSDHHHHGHGHGHDHDHAAGFMDAYGLGHAWDS